MALRRARTLILLLALLVLAALARGVAVERLPIDYDEDDYLRAGQLLAEGLREGDLAIVTRSNYRPEHPPLQKLAIALAVLPLPPREPAPDVGTDAPPNADLPADLVRAARTGTAAFGILQAVVLGLLSPLAGMAVAVNSFHVKYTSQIMLESLPGLTSTLAVLAWLRWRRTRRRGWLAASAIALGLTAAGKYLYAVVGVAMLLDALLERRRANGRALLGWAALAALTFIAADPYLWPDPVGRLLASVFYHAGYAGGADVQRANFPFWQPFVWLAGSVPWSRPAFLFSLDLLINGLALLGLRRLWRRYRVMALWLAVGMAFLLVWPTKWPQYVLILATPIGMAAAEGIYALVDMLRGSRAPTQARRATWREGARALPWLLPGALALLILALLPLLYQLAVAMTDLSGQSLRDGLNGGVLRAGVGGWWGAAANSPFSLFSLQDPAGRAIETRFTGLRLIGEVLSGAFANQTWFSIMWTASSLTLSAVLGVSVALILNRPGLRYAGLWRALFVIPWAIPEFLGGVAWARLAEPGRGWLALGLGVNAPLGEGPAGVFLTQLLAGVWMGFPILMLTAATALKRITPEVYDSAALDGATGVSLLRGITLPLIAPLLAPALVVRGLIAFNQFYLFQPIGSPGGATTLASLAYGLAQSRSAPGRPGTLFAASAAIDVFIVIVLLIAVAALSRRARLAEGVGDA
ncbi:MAG: sugar ABC transporter permease [Thermoflexales bacterium]|nr:sugar ABC transporter permease [Thermoflexales bacterium]